MELEITIDNQKDEMIKKTSELVSFRSIKSEALENAPFGAEIRHSLDYTLDLCKELGFNTKNLDGYAGYAEYGRGDDLVAILVHLDVVPEGTGWTYDPFKLTIDNGRMYGRGVNDDKGAVIASIYALKAVMDSGVKMNKRFRIIFGCDEESGWKCMEHYFSVEENPCCGFSPDGPFPIVNREKGILRIQLENSFNQKSTDSIKIVSLKGGQRPNMVPELCECTLELDGINTDKFIERFNVMNNGINASIDIKLEGNTVLIASYGKSAHGSEPELGVNAVTAMLILLAKFDEINKDQLSFIRFMAEYVGLETNGNSLGVKMNDAESGELTLNMGIIEISEEKASAILDIRYPVTFKGGDITNVIRKKADRNNIGLRSVEDKAPLYIPEDNPLIEKLSRAYEMVTGEEAKLIALKGGTYARAIQNGVAFGPIMPGKEDTAHQKDEYLEIDDFVKSAKIYAQAIIEINK